MTLTHSLHRDVGGPAPLRPPSDPILDRALEAARDRSRDGYYEPWQFHLLHPEAAASVAWLVARHLEPEIGPESARAAYEQWRAVPGWIVVTCPRPAHGDGFDRHRFERDREATLTAVQRASLSLWSDNTPTNWVPDLALDEPAFYRLVEADPVREIALGVLLYGHPEHHSP